MFKLNLSTPCGFSGEPWGYRCTSSLELVPNRRFSPTNHRWNTLPLRQEWGLLGFFSSILHRYFWQSPSCTGQLHVRVTMSWWVGRPRSEWSQRVLPLVTERADAKHSTCHFCQSGASTQLNSRLCKWREVPIFMKITTEQESLIAANYHSVKSGVKLGSRNVLLSGETATEITCELSVSLYNQNSWKWGIAASPEGLQLV